MKYQCAGCGQEFLIDGEDQPLACPVCGSAAQLRRIIRYAGFWRRAAAFTIDFTLWWFSALLLGMVLQLALVAAVPASLAAIVSPILATVSMMSAPVIVFAIPLRLWNGQTPGKRALAIAVVSEDGGCLSWGQCFLRLLLYWVSYAPALLGFLWCVWDARRRCFHDMIVHTVVVHCGEQAAVAGEAKSRDAVLDSLLAGQPADPSKAKTQPVASAVVLDREMLPATVISFPVKWQRGSGRRLAPRKGCIELHRYHMLFVVWTPRVFWFLVLLPAQLLFVAATYWYVLPPKVVGSQFGSSVLAVGLWLALLALSQHMLTDRHDFRIAYQKVHKVQVNSQKRSIDFWMEYVDPFDNSSEVCLTGRPDELIRLVVALKARLEAPVVSSG